MFTLDTDLTRNQIFVSRELSPTIAGRTRKSAEDKVHRKIFKNHKYQKYIYENKNQNRVINSFGNSLAQKHMFMHICFCIHKLIKLPIFSKFMRYSEDILLFETNCHRCGINLDALHKSHIDTNLCVRCNKSMHLPKQRFFASLGRN